MPFGNARHALCHPQLYKRRPVLYNSFITWESVGTMKKNLFLAGPPHCGKTALIRNILGGGIAMAGGFVTEGVYSSDGSLLGHELYPAAAACGIEGFEALRFMDCTVSPFVTDNEIFRVNAVRLLQESAYYPFSVLDAFGGFELIIPQFREALADFLSSDQPCIGVIKTQAEAEKLRLHLGLGERYTAYSQRLHEALMADPDTLILETTGLNDPVARRIVAQWVKEYV